MVNQHHYTYWSVRMKMSVLLSEAVRKRPGNRRWLNFVFLVALALLLAVGIASEEPASTLWPLMVLLAAFAIQSVWSSILGWLLTIACWLLFAFGAFFYERAVYGIQGFSATFLFLWGILPALLLCFFKPRDEASITTTKLGSSRVKDTMSR